MLSIPLGVYGLISLNNFDTSSNAGNQDQAVNSCFITFPYVNPQSVQVDKKVQVQISAYVPDEKIKEINIIDNAGTPVFDKKYTQATNRVIDIFIFSPKTIGAYNFMGTVTTDKASRPCVVQSSTGVNVVATNTAPTFQTLPNNAIPSNAIKVGDDYQYTLKVVDAESDTINYSFSFTPDTDWLKYTVLDDGGKGKLTLKFSGKPDRPASFLANIFVHDGYINHLVSQAWVISVDQDKNDIPKVTVIEPSTAQTVKRGDVLKISWSTQDLNKITKYDLFYATNPGNSSTWVPIAKGLSVKIGNYLFDTSKLALGKYTFIVQATDNFTPPATGTGVSPVVTIDTVGGTNNGPDDGPQLVDPQIINISPTNNSQIKNKRAAISATLIAGTDATIKKDTIKVALDDKDITETVSINPISDTEYTIVYNPTTDYSLGVHKVSVTFEDSKSGKGSKEWNFELIADTTNNDNINIFGWSIPKRTIYIVAGGIGLLVLAILIPWLLYLAWRGSRDQEEYDYTNIYNHTKPIEPTSSNTNNINQYNNITPRPITPSSQSFKEEESTSAKAEVIDEMNSETVSSFKSYPEFEVSNKVEEKPVTKIEEPKVVKEVEKIVETKTVEPAKIEPPITNVNVTVQQPQPIKPITPSQPIVSAPKPVNQPVTVTEEESDLPAIISASEDETTDTSTTETDSSYEELLRLAEQLNQQEVEEEKANGMKSDAGENNITAPSPLPDNNPPDINPNSGLIPNEPIKDNNQQTPQ
ncbi:MAG TPA: hypothetical protein VHA74_02180 [Candidatus Dojkabacteria bacterium]|nr:hypothetical protein [Candidatus Dojkabacteria bacterium]